jgi:hypothetical protein
MHQANREAVFAWLPVIKSLAVRQNFVALSDFM